MNDPIVLGYIGLVLAIVALVMAGLQVRASYNANDLADRSRCFAILNDLNDKRRRGIISVAFYMDQVNRIKKDHPKWDFYDTLRI